MVSQENLKYVCISGNIFVNTQSIKRTVFNDEYTHRSTLLQYLSYEGQQRSQPHVTVIKQIVRHQTICTCMSLV